MDTRLTLVESAASRQLEIVSWGACLSASGKKKLGQPCWVFSRPL